MIDQCVSFLVDLFYSDNNGIEWLSQGLSFNLALQDCFWLWTIEHKWTCIVDLYRVLAQRCINFEQFETIVNECKMHIFE